jgi:exodeoxyribonuclease-3
MKLVTWNINGIRAVIKKGFVDYLKSEKPDVLCLQEIKISESARHKHEFDFPGYQEFWNSAERPGYSGTMTLVKEGINAKPLPSLAWDNEGRVLILEFDSFYLANVYFPNANHELSRLDFKIEFNDRLLAFIKKMEKKKPFFICGDFNVAHEEIDLARPKENVGSPGFTARERAWMTRFLAQGFVDTYRAEYPERVQYTWWSYRAGARARNVGWRIDYFCASRSLAKKVKGNFISDAITGSDHCPVGIRIEN